jgi:hypothetical protein
MRSTCGDVPTLRKGRTRWIIYIYIFFLYGKDADRIFCGWISSLGLPNKRWVIIYLWEVTQYWVVYALENQLQLDTRPADISMDFGSSRQNSGV